MGAARRERFPSPRHSGESELRPEFEFEEEESRPQKSRRSPAAKLVWFFYIILGPPLALASTNLLKHDAPGIFRDILFVVTIGTILGALWGLTFALTKVLEE